MTPPAFGGTELTALAVLCVVGLPLAYAVLLWLADPDERDLINHIIVLLALGASVPPLLTRLAEAAFRLPGSIFPPLLQPYALRPVERVDRVHRGGGESAGGVGGVCAAAARVPRYARWDGGRRRRRRRIRARRGARLRAGPGAGRPDRARSARRAAQHVRRRAQPVRLHRAVRRVPRLRARIRAAAVAHPGRRLRCGRALPHGLRRARDAGQHPGAGRGRRRGGNRPRARGLDLRPAGARRGRLGVGAGAPHRG